jgi:proteasome lid subunit RPN8/RPN11
MKLLFSLEAVSSILVECYKGNNNLETGGIFIGPQSHKGIVTDILPSTAFAERRPATYYQSEKDVKILNQRLRQFQARGYDFKGYFHRHPSGLFRLSGGDLRTCEEILKSPNYHIHNCLIMCIITESQTQDFPIFSYVTSLDENQKVVVEKAQVKILPKSCILECAECFEPIQMETNNETNNFRHNQKSTERPKTSSPIRSARKRGSDNLLPKKGALV